MMPRSSDGRKPGIMRRRFVIVHNRWAGNSDQRVIAAVLDELNKAGCDARVLQVAGRGGVEDAVSKVALDGVDAIVAAGGDGTISAVVRSVFVGTPDASRRLPIAIVALGTANVIAHELALPRQPGAIASMLMHGPGTPCTLALAGAHLFVAMGTVGFDSHVVDHVSQRLKRLIGKGAYWLQILLQSVRYDFPMLQVEIDGRTDSAASVAILNGSRYGGDHVVLPRANLAGPELHVVLMRRPGTRNMIRYLVAAMRGRLTGLADVDVVQARHSVRFIAPHGLAVQADGHVIGRTPLSIEVLPQAVTLIRPCPE
jgi:YegS/Rv2252/BmrU family lipid kinase